MAEHDGTKQSKNRYDTGNRYEQEPPPKSSAPPRLSVPATGPLNASETWKPRAASAPAVYEPTLGERRRARRAAERLVENQGVATTVVKAGVQLTKALQELETSRQELEDTQERRKLIPLKVEREKFLLGEDLVKAQSAFEAVLDEQQDDRVDRQRRRQLDTEDFENMRLRKEAERLEWEARIDAANAKRAYAPEIGKRRAQAELARAEEEAMRHEADAAAERRRRDQQRAPAAVEPMDDVPADLRAPLATERTVATTHQWVERKEAQIRKRAQAEGRPLTADEIEQIDQYRDAAANGEAAIRRRGATDLS